MLGNFGSSNDHFVGVGPWNGDMTLGDWGVNTSNHTVWAVLDHNSEFAVTPEPSTLALLAAGAYSGLPATAGGGGAKGISETPAGSLRQVNRSC